MTSRAPPAAPPGPQTVQLAESLPEEPPRRRQEVLAMPLGVLEGPECFDCGARTHCICVPGGQNFSQAPRGERNGQAGPALERSLRDLLQSGQDLRGAPT